MTNTTKTDKYIVRGTDTHSKERIDVSIPLSMKDAKKFLEDIKHEMHLTKIAIWTNLRIKKI